ncbi:MAG: hypothetical protein OEX17_02080 [Rhodospirillaceae bacterium]|nr:hypothetical protein [Rhodospirillaceae bacterium]
MPLDLKKIIFSNEEIQALMVNYCLRTNVSMPDTRIGGVELLWEPELQLDIKFLSKHENGYGRTLSFSNSEVAAAVIMYCRLNKEPLPKTAEKKLEPVGDDGLALCLRFPWGEMWNKDHPGFDVEEISTAPNMANKISLNVKVS